MSRAETYPSTLYRYYNEAGVLLYVGVTYEARGRLQQHRLSKDWYYDIKFIRLDHFPAGRDEALRAEALAIKNEKPLYNGIPYKKYVPNHLKARVITKQ